MWVGQNTIIDTALPFLIRPIRVSELPFSSARPRSLVISGMPNVRVLPVPNRDRPILSRPTNTGTKALTWTGVKLVIYVPDIALMTFWVHPFVVECGFDVEVKLGSRKSILDSTSNPSYSYSSSSYDDDNDNPYCCPPSTCCCCMYPHPPRLAVMVSISSTLLSVSFRAPDKMPSRTMSRSSFTVKSTRVE